LSPMRSMSRSHAKRRAWWVLQGLTAACLLALLLLPSHRYAWMRELDPGFNGRLPDDVSGDRWVLIGLLLGGCMVAQGLSAWLAPVSRLRWLALGLGVLCAVVTIWRFGIE